MIRVKAGTVTGPGIKHCIVRIAEGHEGEDKARLSGLTEDDLGTIAFPGAGVIMKGICLNGCTIYANTREPLPGYGVASVFVPPLPGSSETNLLDPLNDPTAVEHVIALAPVAGAGEPVITGVGTSDEWKAWVTWLRGNMGVGTACTLYEMGILEPRCRLKRVRPADNVDDPQKDGSILRVQRGSNGQISHCRFHLPVPVGADPFARDVDVQDHEHGDVWTWVVRNY